MYTSVSSARVVLPAPMTKAATNAASWVFNSVRAMLFTFWSAILAVVLPAMRHCDRDDATIRVRRFSSGR